MPQFEQGNYAGCNLKEWSFPEGKSGAVEVHLKFEVAENTMRTVYLYTTDAAWPYTSEKLKALGWNGKVEGAEFTNPNNHELYCKHEEYPEGSGKVNEKWNLSQGMKDNAPADKTRMLEARFRNEHGASKPPARTAAPAAPAKPATSAPARPSAAPARPADPKFGKDQVWDIYAGKGRTTEHFYAVIESEEKRTGRVEADFTEADWKAVAEGVDTPF